MGARATATGLVLAVAITLCLAGPRAKAEELVTDLSQHLIAVKSTFTGTKLLLFGAVEAESPEIRALERDVIIVIRGPRQAMTSRRKAKVAGIWMNYDSRTYASVPGYYAILSTRALEAIASREVLERHQIGMEYLRLRPEHEDGGTDGADDNKELDEAFRQSVLRLMQGEDLYSEVAGGVTFLGHTLFRAEVDIPANVPVGNYTADVYLIRDGSVIHAQATPLYINKIGFERFVFNLAHRQPLVYGVVSVVLALVAGWAAAAIFRKT